MISFIFGFLALAAFSLASAALGCMAGTAAVIDKLADGDDDKKLEICEKLKNNTH